MDFTEKKNINNSPNNCLSSLNSKSMNSYLGKKGYTLLKSEITSEQIALIKKELTIHPFVQGAPVNNSTVFYAFRESKNKYYLPRYFGEKHFGPATKVILPPGDDIILNFRGVLRDYQQPVVDTFFDNVFNKGGSGGLFDLPCAAGKTTISLYIMSVLKKKTIVLVHKEFLMNQWIERIQQFLPEARIGKIQGPIIDIENKDIVLAMIQSISMKEYPENLFDTFGFMVIDEVHHISSEVFSNTLFKLVLPYSLGLSATMNRKDGTSFVFKLFLGDVIYKGKREEKHSVVVRAIDFYINDYDFNEVVYDYRGNPQYSTMITKLCDCNRRSEFILKVLIDMLKENDKQQVMILAHNKSLLKYLFDAIQERKIATVGYYVGGMKEEALKQSESKQVIIATYSMASEGLDIKSLTTLIMATPKTEIEQTVGRILREKHSQPVVVDIIDHQPLFQNQWQKRKLFYKKQNYKIIHTDNSQYQPNTDDWDVLYDSCSKINGVNDKINGKNRISSVNPNDDILKGKCFLKLPKTS